MIQPLIGYQEIKKYDELLDEKINYIKEYDENEKKIDEINKLIDENKDNKTMIDE